MKNTTTKKGISLIVLILTIIVMIILATAIILSISNSGIISKANKAKQDSDTANLTEYVNVLKAEWDLMTETERAGQKKEEYVNAKLEAKGYTGALLMEDGTLYTNLQANTKAALKDGIQIGNKVNYTITTKNKYTPDSSKTGTTNIELETQTDLTWLYIGVSDKGELLISPDVSSGVLANSNVNLSGKTGWLTGVDELNTVCDKLYTVVGKGTARSMNIDDVFKLLGYIGPLGGFQTPLDPVSDVSFWERTDVPAKIADLESLYGVQTEGRFTPTAPDGVDSDLGEYYSNSIQLDFSADSGYFTCPSNLSLVVPDPGCYWLASRAVAAYFSMGPHRFSVQYVHDGRLSGFALYYSSIGGDDISNMYGQIYTIRPVVSLTCNIEKYVDDELVVWNLVQ